MTVTKLLSVLLVVTLLAPGILAPPAAVAQSETGDHDGAYAAGAVAVNVFYVPGRAIMCGLGTAFGVVFLGLTFGSAYRQAKFFFEEGCVEGPWVLDGDDLRRANAERGIREDSYFLK
jgi:hypothetical protein